MAYNSWLINRGDPNHLQVLGWSEPSVFDGHPADILPMPASLAKGRNDGLAGSWLVGNS